MQNKNRNILFFVNFKETFHFFAIKTKNNQKKKLLKNKEILFKNYKKQCKTYDCFLSTSR